MTFKNRKTKGLFFVFVPPGVAMVLLFVLAAIRIVVESQSSGPGTLILEKLHIGLAFVSIFVLFAGIGYGCYLLVDELFKGFKCKK